MEICQHCQNQIHAEQGTWVDNSGGDVCGWNGGNEPHEPTPDFSTCEGCGDEINFVYNKDERFCQRCIGEYDQQIKDQNWDYYS